MTEYICEFVNDESGKVTMVNRKQELIRCKDCKYYGQNGYRYGCIHAVPIMMPNNYCSNAERK